MNTDDSPYAKRIEADMLRAESDAKALRVAKVEAVALPMHEQNEGVQHVEKAAQAIHHAVLKRMSDRCIAEGVISTAMKSDWAGLLEEVRQDYRKDVRVALRAMQEARGGSCPRRFKATNRASMEKPHGVHYGTYFPGTDLLTWDTGEHGTGMPQGEVEWLD